MHCIAWARTFALLRAGNNSAARMAMMAITTRSSISVKPWRAFDWNLIRPKPPALAQLNWFASIDDFKLLLEPVELLGTGDGIGHDVLPVDYYRRRRIGEPTCRRTEIIGGCQIESWRVGRPRQNSIGAVPLDL